MNLNKERVSAMTKKAQIPILVSALLITLVATTQAQTTVTQTVTYEVQAINEIGLNSPLTLTINTATAGALPYAATDNTTTYSIKTATDNGGKFTFSAPSGTYLLNIDPSSIGIEKTAMEKLPVKIAVEAGKAVNLELTIVKAATLSGQVVLGTSEPAHIPNAVKPVVVGELGSIETPKVFKGILVELSRDDETMRMLTDDEGKFSFINIRPGTWKFKAYDYNLPAYHYIQNPEMEITLSPGEKKDITVKVLPKQRQTEILEEGVIQGK